MTIENSLHTLLNCITTEDTNQPFLYFNGSLYKRKTGKKLKPRKIDKDGNPVWILRRKNTEYGFNHSGLEPRKLCWRCYRTEIQYIEYEPIPSSTVPFPPKYKKHPKGFKYHPDTGTYEKLWDDL